MRKHKGYVIKNKGFKRDFIDILYKIRYKLINNIEFTGVFILPTRN